MPLFFGICDDLEDPHGEGEMSGIQACKSKSSTSELCTLQIFSFFSCGAISLHWVKLLSFFPCAAIQSEDKKNYLFSLACGASKQEEEGFLVFCREGLAFSFLGLARGEREREGGREDKRKRKTFYSYIRNYG
jgi:hypothetical protein